MIFHMKQFWYCTIHKNTWDSWAGWEKIWLTWKNTFYCVLLTKFWDKAYNSYDAVCRWVFQMSHIHGSCSLKCKCSVFSYMCDDAGTHALRRSSGRAHEECTWPLTCLGGVSSRSRALWHAADSTLFWHQHVQDEDLHCFNLIDCPWRWNFWIGTFLNLF